jgi:chromosome segregation ATPase
LELKLKDDPQIVREMENNLNFKKKIEQLEVDLIDLNSNIEQMEVVNSFLYQKKDNIISERKKIISQNEDLKREIDAQKQLNEIRIQKKVKEYNSPEYRKFEDQLLILNKNISEVEQKIGIEKEKIDNLTKELIKLDIQEKHLNEIRQKLIDSVDSKLKEITNMKSIIDDMKRNNLLVKEKVIINN